MESSLRGSPGALTLIAERRLMTIPEVTGVTSRETRTRTCHPVIWSAGAASSASRW